MQTKRPLYLERVLRKLDHEQVGQDSWVAICPCPDHGQNGDQDPSLSIALGEDGRILMTCRVGCPTEAVLEALGLDWKDLFRLGHMGETANETITTVAKSKTNSSPEKAEVDLCARAYLLLLENLVLSEEHREDLHRRGLDDADIAKRNYRSLRNIDRGRVARSVHSQLGKGVLGVPGFVQ